MTHSNIIKQFTQNFTSQYHTARHGMLEPMHCQGYLEIRNSHMRFSLNILLQLKKGTIICYKADPYSFNMVWFCHVFWAFGPSIEGFSYCHPLLSIDDTHLYEK